MNRDILGKYICLNIYNKVRFWLFGNNKFRYFFFMNPNISWIISGLYSFIPLQS